MRHRSSHVLLVAATAMLARADILEVPQGFPTIQQAIDAAVAGDEIVVSPGVYLENVTLTDKDVLIRSLDPADPPIVAATIVDGDAAGPVVDMNTGELRGLTIRNGSAQIGAGVIARGDARVRFCNVTDNVAAAQGGGIAAFDQAAIDHNRIIANRAERGGGVLAEDLAMIRGNLIAGNFGFGEGGGIASNAHAGLIAGNTLLANLGVLNASGMLVQDALVTANIVAFSPSGVVAIFAEGDMAQVDFNCVFANAGGSFGGAGEFGDRNIERDPELETIADGIWTNEPSFDPLTFRTTFIDLDGSFIANQLIGLLLLPDTNGPLHFAVVANTSNTITVLGDAIALAGSGDPYRLFDWHIGPASPCLAATDRDGPLETLTGTDLDGEPRLMDCLADIGADERTGTESNVLFVRANSALVALGSSPPDCTDLGAFSGGANLFYERTPTVTLTAESFNDVGFRWVIDGVEQTEGLASVEIELIGPVTAVAQYDLVTNLTIGLRFDTIQDAISSFSTADGDDIVVAPALYVENVDFLGKDLFVHSTDPDNPAIVARTIIDGNQAASTVRLSAGEIRGFTIRNGDDSSGGGVYSEGNAIVTQNVVERNAAWQSGSGILALDDVLVEGNVVRDNGSSQTGSGIYAADRVVVINNLVENNIGDVSDEAGGIHVRENAIACNNIVRGNQAGRGGGISAQRDAVVLDNLIIDNVALNRGGGIYVLHECLIERNWIQDNIALAEGNGGTEVGGGGVYAYNTPMIRSNVIIGNDSIAPGGGVDLGFGADLFANTIVDNTSNLGADGVWVDGIHEEFRVVNNIIAFNGERGIVADDPVFLDFNCVFGHGSQDYGGLAFPGDNDINVDPQLDADRAHLLPTSPAIDAGVVGFRDPDGTDIDGDARVINDRIDIGADEFAGSACPADLDGDGDADADDFFAYLDAFATGDLAICDIDADADCDADDFFAYLDLFADACP